MNFESTRRDFLRTLGKGALGAAALTAIPAVVSAESTTDAPVWPWKWQYLDPKEVMDKTFVNFPLNGGCGGGVSSGIMDLMAEKYGHPYNYFPAKMMALAGGGYGRKNLCGALGGAFAVLGFFCEPADANALRNALYAWYETTAFPIYQPADETVPVHAHHTVSGSELCVKSVSTWMAAAGLNMETDFGKPERVMRCRCLSADVAGKTVELLNAHFGLTEAPVEEDPVFTVGDNQYLGKGVGRNGNVWVLVTMNGDQIANVEVLKASDDGKYELKEDGWALGIAEAATCNWIVANQSTELPADVVSGATLSGNGIAEAVKDALSKIGK